MNTEKLRFDRRALVTKLTAAGVSAPMIASMTGSATFAQDGTPDTASVLASLGKSEDLIEHGTTTFETPLEGFSEFLTPNEQFFIRSNGPLSMEIDPAEWRLTVTGLVDNELEFSLDDLQAMETKTITTWVECSGNTRSRFLDEPERVSGTQWGNGAIGNAEWTGVPVSAILEQAGVQDGVVDMVSQGGDFEAMQRGLPIDVAMNGDVMLVWQMNGEDLPAPNGGPVRLLVPRWGGIASTKWVVNLDMIDYEFDGTFNVDSYVIINVDGEVERPVREMPVKSVITSVAPDEEIEAGSHTLAGIAWSGHGAVSGIEVSVDNGENWEAADVVEEAGELSWVRFEYAWEAESGETTLLSRASDEAGNVQPDNVEDIPWNALGYQMNAVYPVAVTVS